MSTPAQKLTVLQDFNRWRETQSEGGVDISAEAYVDWLQHRVNERLLVDIEDIANAGLDRDPDKAQPDLSPAVALTQIRDMLFAARQ